MLHLNRTGRRQEEISFPPGATLQDVAEWLNGQYDLSLPNLQVMMTLGGSGLRKQTALLLTMLQALIST